jgi:hypothetical protein
MTQENEDCYKLTVIGGKGSGEYEVGEKVLLYPDEKENYKFVGWGGDVYILSTPDLDTVIATIPTWDVEIRALFSPV